MQPADPSTLSHINGGNNSAGTTIVGFILFFAFIIGFFVGGWIISLFIFILWVVFGISSDRNASEEYRKQLVTEAAETYSKQLNSILSKSEEIINNILPYFESCANRSIQNAKYDFAQNAISPFWDRIEETSNYLGCYKEAINQLVINGELYTKILANKRHNFPLPFPLGTNISIPVYLLDDFNSTVRKAQTRFEFANIWEHRKTQKILIAGFNSLEQAIYGMKDSIVNSIHELKLSIQSDFIGLKNIQIEALNDFKRSQHTINDTLNSMDNKLYYIQYSKKPTTPFLRRFND